MVRKAVLGLHGQSLLIGGEDQNIPMYLIAGAKFLLAGPFSDYFSPLKWTVMGMITGISVLVRGTGVMNVTPNAITEIARGVGIRKAAGARRKDMVLLFLTESVTISLAGSLFDRLLGLATLAAATPVI